MSEPEEHPVRCMTGSRDGICSYGHKTVKTVDPEGWTNVLGSSACPHCEGDLLTRYREGERPRARKK